MTPPVVTILTGPAIATTDTTATFTFSVDDPAALVPVLTGRRGTNLLYIAGHIYPALSSQQDRWLVPTH